MYIPISGLCKVGEVSKTLDRCFLLLLMRCCYKVMRVLFVFSQIGIIRRNASLENLRAYGAFLVTSTLKEGLIQGVNLVSEKDVFCKIENPWKGHPCASYPGKWKIGHTLWRISADTDCGG